MCLVQAVLNDVSPVNLQSVSKSPSLPIYYAVTGNSAAAEKTFTAKTTINTGPFPASISYTIHA
jgi:hypothetical protein